MKLHKALSCSAIAMLAVLLAASGAMAHGVRTEVVAGATSTITVTSDHGEPLAGASFTVTAPGAEGAWLSGTTDPHGRVVFQPDRAGLWSVRVATADGHGAVVSVDVSAAQLAGGGAAAPVAAHHDAGPGHVHATGTEAVHDHEHDHDAEAGHAPAATSPAPARGGAAYGAIAGLALVLAVLGGVYVLLRLRARDKVR